MPKALTIKPLSPLPNQSFQRMNWAQYLVGAAIVVMTLAAYFSYGIIRRLTLESLKQNAFLEVQHGADEIDSWLAALKTQTEAIANTPTVKTLDWSVIEPYFIAELNRIEDPFKLSLIGKDRYLIANTSVGLSPKDLRHRPYLKEVMQGKTFVSNAVVSPTTGIAQILISTPIWGPAVPMPSLTDAPISDAPISDDPLSDDLLLDNRQTPPQRQEILGAVNHAVAVERMSEVISSLSYGDHSYAFVVNSEGQAMVHPDAQRMSTQEKPAASLLDDSNADLAAVAQQMVNRQAGIELRSIDGDLQYIAYYPIQEANWMIAFVIPKENIEQQIRPLDLIAIAFGALAVSQGIVLWQFQSARYRRWHQRQAIAEADNQELERRVQMRTLELAQSQERARVTLASIGDAVITTDADGYIDYLNPVAEILTGWPLAAVTGKPLRDVFQIVNEQSRQPAIDPVARCLREGCTVGLTDNIVLINRYGKEYAIEDSAAPIRDNNHQVTGVVLVFYDVSEKRRLQQEITYQAKHDALTDLFNRYEFERRLQQAIETAQSTLCEHAVCYLDLDQFKVINDTCGHAAGDALLQRLSVLLKRKIRHHDTLARLGGDEFGVLLAHASLAQAQVTANALRQACEDFIFSWQNQRFRIGVSIGLVAVDATSTSVANVLQAADSACYAAKDTGRNRVHVYLEHDEILAQRYGEMQWISRLQQALEDDRFELYAQPIVALDAPSAEGFHCELLLRLKEGDGKVSLPGAFMPAAERYNLAGLIDRWVVRHAFQWFSAHPVVFDKFSLCTLNLSGHSIGDNTFHTYVLQQLNDIGLPAEKICFELTETAAVSNLAEVARFMQTLRKRGCRFALDDFGSGLSSFGYLKALPVDFLKIDGLFVKDIVEDPVDLAMVRSINEIAQLLNKKTVAEYVENDAILQQLRLLGVDYGQGYGLGRPQPLSALLNRGSGGIALKSR